MFSVRGKLSVFALLLGLSAVGSQFTPDWESLDSRPLPVWYDDAKVGIFVHWGVYSVPSFGSEWFWINWKEGENKEKYEQFMAQNYKPGFTYQDFGRDFTAEFFKPDEWAELFQSSGARYVVLTSKHHEGYGLWPSKYMYSWNSVDVGPHRNLVGELANSIRNLTQMDFGLYHSLFEWFHPLWLQDKGNNFSTNNFVVEKILPEMRELVETYRPSILWSDGEWDAPDWYWNSTEFIAWLFNDSPVKNRVVTNDRWGQGTLCTHGDFYTCADRYNPGVLQDHKWENCMTIDKQSWGYRRDAKIEDYMSYDELIEQLVTTVSCGGNILINVGPTKEGTITPIYQERLRQLGEWLGVNGEAIYSSRPWTFQNETVQTGVWYTQQAGNVYAAVLDRPEDGVLVLNHPQPGPSNQVTILGYLGAIEWSSLGQGITITMPDMSLLPGIPSPWVFKFSDILN